MAVRVWLTLPTYNEADNLEPLVRACHEQLVSTGVGDFRILVVDDNSPDGTGELAERLARTIPELEVLRRPRKEGLGPAYLAGYRRALDGGAELILVMDADFSHDPSYLPALLQAADGADLVLGSRYVDGGGVADWPWLRRVLSRGGGLYARAILGVGIRDLTSGYRCIRRHVLEGIDAGSLRSQGYVFNIEFTYRALLAGFRVREVPIVFGDRRAGRSKMSLPIAIEALTLVPSLRRRARRFRAERASVESVAPAGSPDLATSGSGHPPG
jgi:dolichol-phosphate mannosyltransferase